MPPPAGPQLPPGTDVWAVPAAPPPPGVIPNLANPETNENIGIVTLSVFIAIATIFVGMRLYAQFGRLNNSKPWWDDVALLLALPPQIAFTGIYIYMAKMSMIGRHIWETPLGVVMYRLPYWTVVFAALGQPITGLVKLSLLLLYLRIFNPIDHIRWGCIFGIVIVSTMYTAWTFIFIFITAFNNEIGAKLSWAQAGFNLATDVYIFVLPVLGVLPMNLVWRRKLGVIAIFATGAAAIVMSALTLYWRVDYNGQSPDPTWTGTTRLMLTVLETDVGIMCACMPLFSPYFPRLKNSFSGWSRSLRSIRSRLLKSTSGSRTGGGSSKGGSTVGEKRGDLSSEKNSSEQLYDPSTVGGDSNNSNARIYDGTTQGSYTVRAQQHDGGLSSPYQGAEGVVYVQRDVELGKVESASSSTKNSSRKAEKEWFDKTGSLLERTVIDPEEEVATVTSTANKV